MPTPMAKLRSVFGSFAQSEPEPSKRDVEAQEKAEAEAAAHVASGLPKAPVYDQNTGVLTSPTKRFDGSSEDPPWNVPEPILWDWLRTVEIDGLGNDEVGGTGGTLWAKYKNHDGQDRVGLLRMSGVAREHALNALGFEYGLEGQYDLLKREQAAYESMKALGCEDMAPPVAAREVDMASLVSAPLAERVAKSLRIKPAAVAEVFGSVGLLQALPLESENFAEYWAKLGPDDSNRWERASARLRHSIYRAILIDFLLGVPNRMLCDFTYQRSSDSLAVYGFEVSFPHPGMTAEWYLAMRKKGWGRKFSGPLEEPMLTVPAGGTDSLAMMGTFSDQQEEEMVLTAKQMVKGFDPQVATLLIQVLVEIGVPPACVSSLVSRMVFLENDPGNIVGGSFDYVRSVLVPLRRGYGLEEGRIQMVSTTTSQIMTDALGKQFDFAKVVQEPAPEGTDFVI